MKRIVIEFEDRHEPEEKRHVSLSTTDAVVGAIDLLLGGDLPGTRRLVWLDGGMIVVASLDEVPE